MKIPSLVRLPSHRSFQFEPRYYSELKEKIEEMRKNVEAEANVSPADREYVSKIKFKREKSDKKAVVSAAILRIVMLVILGLGGLAYIKLDGLENYVLGVVLTSFFAFIWLRSRLES